MYDFLSSIAHIHDLQNKRASSYDRTGGNADCVVAHAGETLTLANITGAGVIKHIWLTLRCDDPMIRRNAVLRMYWDGEEHPSVECPLGDFFGQGWGEAYPFLSLPMAAAPEHGKALNSYWPMPYGDGARITLENQSDLPIASLYYYIDYEIHPQIDERAGRFHAWWNRQITVPHSDRENEWSVLGPTPENRSDQHNHLFAEIEGRGHFAGIHYYVDNPGPMWYGEGDDMWMIDGESWPGSLHGTGTEDFFNSSWCPNEIYQHPFFGYARVPQKLGWMGRTHAYRFFLSDPIHFSRSLRASIEHGHANVLTLDLATVAFWYQTEPHKTFPAFPGKPGRQNMPEIQPTDVHRWRDAWRNNKQGGALWGNE